MHNVHPTHCLKNKIIPIFPTLIEENERQLEAERLLEQEKLLEEDVEDKYCNFS